MRYHLMFIFLSVCDGFLNIADDEDNKTNPCEPNPCQNGGSCYESDIEGEFVCLCLNGFTGSLCENNSCTPNPCKNGGSCTVSRDNDGFSCDCPVEYKGDKCDFDKCSMCQENEVCVIENEDVKCKIEDPCISKLCENGGSCIANSDLQEGFECSCKTGYIGVTCETDKCSILQCRENEDCVIENEDVICKIRDLCSQHECKNGGTCLVEEEYSKCICAESFWGDNCQLRKSGDTSEDPATTISTKATSTTVTTHKEKVNKTTTSGNSVKTTTVTETSNTHRLLSSSSIVTKSTTAFTKATTKITKSTKNKVAPTTRVSLNDHSSTSIEITSQANTDDHHKHFTVSSSSSSVRNTTAFDNNTVKTSHSLIGGLTTVEYTTDTKNEFKSSSRNSPKISSQSSTSMSTSASTDNSGYTSEGPQVTISTSTESKEKTESINFKSTGTDASTTETLNNTSATNHDSGNDINRTNASSQTITLYASLGAVCFAVLVAFAVGGWYMRRRCRRRKRQCYTECDTSSQISGNSNSSYSSP